MAPTNNSQKRSHDQFSNDLYDASPLLNQSASEDAGVGDARRTLASSIVATFRRDTVEKLLVEVALENPATMKAIIDMNTQNLTNKLLADNTPKEPSAQGGTGEELQGPESLGNQFRSNVVQPQPGLLSASNSTSKASAICSSNAARPSLNTSKNQNPNVVSVEQSAINGDKSVETPAPISNTPNHTAAQTSSQSEEEGTPKSAKKLANVKKTSKDSQILLFDEVRVKVEQILSQLPSAYGTSERSKFGTQKATIIAILENEMFVRVTEVSCFNTKLIALRTAFDLCFLFVNSLELDFCEEVDMLRKIAMFVERIAGWMTCEERCLVENDKKWWCGMQDLTTWTGPEKRKILKSMMQAFLPVAGQK